MDNYYLYGARNDDERYYNKFQTDYENVGDDFLSEIKDKSQAIAKHNQLLLTMEKGISNAKTLAEQQIRAFGWEKGDIQDFCEAFNGMIKNFEVIAYRLLEEYANSTAYDILELADPWSGIIINQETKEKGAVTRQRTLDEIMTKVSKEGKIKGLLNSMNKDIQDSATKFFNHMNSLISNPDHKMKKYLDDLLESRKGDLSRKSINEKGDKERNFQYRPDFGGKMGELTGYITSRGMAAVCSEFIKELTKGKGKGFKPGKMAITGGDGTKVDRNVGALLFQDKNYSGIRQRFMWDKKGKEFPDIKIQSSGSLGNVLENFARDTSGGMFSEQNSGKYFSFIMNALYFKEYGDDTYYAAAKEALDLLVNVYAYVFLVQGTAGEKLGYSILDINSGTQLPGFMWLTGKGIVPMYRILIEITDNFRKILGRGKDEENKYVNRSGVYSLIKIKDQGAAVNKVDSTTTHPKDPKSMSNNGSFYIHSECYPKLTNPPDVLTKRYEDFANTVKTSVKLNMQIASLESMMARYTGTTRTNV